MSMHAASRELWRGLKACSADWSEENSRFLQRALSNYLLNYVWGMTGDDVDKCKRLLLSLAYDRQDEAMGLVSELAPGAIREIDGYDEWWRAELAGEHKK